MDSHEDQIITVIPASKKAIIDRFEKEQQITGWKSEMMGLEQEVLKLSIQRDLMLEQREELTQKIDAFANAIENKTKREEYLKQLLRNEGFFCP